MIFHQGKTTRLHLLSFIAFWIARRRKRNISISLAFVHQYAYAIFLVLVHSDNESLLNLNKNECINVACPCHATQRVLNYVWAGSFYGFSHRRDRQRTVLARKVHFTMMACKRDRCRKKENWLLFSGIFSAVVLLFPREKRIEKVTRTQEKWEKIEKFSY